jgi:hypothetical protein
MPPDRPGAGSASGNRPKSRLRRPNAGIGGRTTLFSRPIMALAVTGRSN